MSERLSPTQILRIIRDGPASRKTLTAQQVRSAARTRPERFDRALVRLNFSMLDKQYRDSGRDTFSPYERFVRPAQSGPIMADWEKNYKATLA